MTRKANFVPAATADLFEPDLSKAQKGRVKRAADIVTPPRAAQHLAAPSDWSFDLIEPDDELRAMISGIVEREVRHLALR